MAPPLIRTNFDILPFDMNRVFVAFLAGVCLLLACRKGADFDPNLHLTPVESTDFRKSIVRYVAPLPKNGTNNNRFAARFDAHYAVQLNRIRLDKYYPSPDGYHYFEVSQPAASFKNKRVSTAGKLRYDNEGAILSYEESYRTWKMEEDMLQKKTSLLFSLLITGKDLTPYAPENSEEEFIEFPDTRVVYDKTKREWVSMEAPFPSSTSE
jgi:hypothetical protein